MSASGGSSTSGWLLAQLPQVMATDDVISRFVLAFEEVADTVRDRVSSIDFELDINLASPEMLSFLGAWLGAELDTVTADDPDAAEAQRRIIRAIGKVLGWRGTSYGLRILLEALTGARVYISDSGGVFGSRDPIPEARDVIRIELTGTGGLSERQLLAFLSEEVPVGAQVELRLRGHGGRR